MKTTLVEGANTSRKVMLYALSTCGWCKKTKALLSELDVEYEYVDVDTLDREDQRQAITTLKSLGLPVAFPIMIVDDEKIIQGYKAEEIRRELEG